MTKVIPPMDSTSTDTVADNISKLKALFPEAFTESKVDFDALKEVLGDYVDGRDERYSFTWNGKSKARMIAQTPSTGTLRPCKEESVDWDSTQNLFIEGDNLEVLKLLQKSYHKKVKMIYIDPPYNTGKDFVYKDNFKDNIKNYKEITGQVDGEGRNLSNNPETSGRYHTDWLNMMYPRLKLARNLLKDDGIIFISIDDNEFANLKNICDEIFGEENALFIYTIKVRYEGKTLVEDMLYQKVVENVLVYAKSRESLSLVRKVEDYNYEKFIWDIEELENPTTLNLGGKRVDVFTKQQYRIVKKEPNNELLKEIWASGSILDGNSSGRFFRDYFTGRYNQDGYGVLYKVYGIGDDSLDYRYFTGPQREGATRGKYYQGVPNTVLDAPDDAKRRKPIETFFDLAADFGNCRHEGGVDFRSGKKPLALFNKLFEIMPWGENDLILDFFAGSASTAHAVMQLNTEENGNRKFIMVQLPEATDEKTEAFKTGYKTIAEISKERIRRAAAKIQAENPDYQGDLGFKVFKLDSTNIKPWELDFDLTSQDLEDQISNIKTDRKEEDVLYEVLLKYGLDLTLPITEHSIAGHKVFNIGMGALMVCLSDKISLEVAEGIAKLKEELNPEIMRVVFKDAGFADDVVKTNALQILKQAGIEDVRSL